MVNRSAVAGISPLGQLCAFQHLFSPAPNFSVVPGISSHDAFTQEPVFSPMRRAFFANGSPSPRKTTSANGINPFEISLGNVIGTRLRDIRPDPKDGICAEFTRLIRHPMPALMKEVLRLDFSNMDPNAQLRHWLVKAKELFHEAIADIEEEKIPESIRDEVGTFLAHDWNKTSPDRSLIRQLEEYVEKAVQKYLDDEWKIFGDRLLKGDKDIKVAIDHAAVRGELIRLHYDLQRAIEAGDAEKQAELEASQNKLQKKLERKLIEALELVADEVEFKWERGYLKHINLSRDTTGVLYGLFDNEDTRFLRELSLGWMAMYSFEDVLQMPEISRLTGLELNIGPVDGDCIGPLSQSPYLESLQVLYLDNNEMPPEVLEYLSRAKFSLRELNLSNNPWIGSGFRYLKQANNMTWLEKLYLSHCELSDQDILSLCQIDTLRSIRVIYLQECCDVKALTQAPWLPLIEELDLTDCEIDNEFMENFSRANLGSLRVLDLSCNGIDDEVLENFIQAPWLASLNVLNLAGTFLSDDGIARFVPALKSIQVLDLNAYNLGPKAISAISTHLTSLHTLGMAPDESDDTSILGADEALCLTRMKSLRKLCAAPEDFGDEGMKIVISNPNLELVDARASWLYAYDRHNTFGGVEPGWSSPSWDSNHFTEDDE